MLIGVDENNNIVFEFTDESYLKMLEEKFGRRPTVQDFCPPGFETNLTSIYMSKKEFEDSLKKECDIKEEKTITLHNNNNDYVAVSV